MKGKLKRVMAPLVAPVVTFGLAATLIVSLGGCATAPRKEVSILDAVAAQSSMNPPQSCAAMNAATVCVQTMRLSKNKSCGCVDRGAISEGNFSPRF